MLMIHDISSGPSTTLDDKWRIQDDEGFNWNNERKEKWSWSQEKECYVDPKGNPTVDSCEVDFEALVAAIPTVGVWCRGLKEIPYYREKAEERINKVIYASLEKKKKTVEEIVDESQKLVNEEAVAEKQQVMEDQQKMAEEAEVPNADAKNAWKRARLVMKRITI
ncbi:hypothetical protein Hanom_Chr06g00553291 [Helianthus anomalus]